MQTLANSLNFKFILFTLFIVQIRSLSTGESIYNKNVIVLDAVSDWKYRQETEQIHQFDKTSDEKYFAIEELNNLNLAFKDNPNYKNRFSKDLDKCSRLNVSYSFDYYMDAYPTIKIIRWSVHLLDGKAENLKVQMKKWTSVSKTEEISLRKLKTRFSKSELFEMYINTLDRIQNDKFRNSLETKFAIKNLQLTFACKSAIQVIRFDSNLTSNQIPFTFERNSVELNSTEQVEFWSNKVFPQFIRGSVDKYYYTEKSFKQLNFIITETNFTENEDVCLTFDYFVTKGAYINVNFINSHLQQKSLIKLYTSEFNERLTNDAVSLTQTKLQWINATVCVKGSEILSNEKDKLSQWNFESFINRPELKSDIVAVTNFNVVRKNVNLKDFIPNWKFNGESAMNDWKTVPSAQQNFRLSLTDDHELKLYLREMPSKTRRHYYVISDWIEVNKNVDYLTFKVNSNLTNYHLTCKIQADENGEVDYKSWKLNGIIKDQLLQYNLERAISKSPEISRIKIIFEIYNDKTISLINYASDESKFEKNDKEQLLTISEIQLADSCTDERICNNNGKCKALAAKKAQCSCQFGWHGKNCEFINKCEQEVKIGSLNKTGNEFCKLKNRNCMPDEGTFSCECKADEHWNDEIFECQIVTGCSFKFCGLNEECRIEDGRAVCACKSTFEKRNGICLKDLCSDPEKKCPKNQLCMHVENEVNPICYCPKGSFKDDSTGECIDIRKSKLASKQSPYGQINPFILQKHNCQQDYLIDGDQVKCTCLPGYEMNSNDKCEATFNTEGCGCKKNQVCIEQNEKKQCVCKPGFLGTDCLKDICSEDKEDQFCGDSSCYVTDDNRFVCNCNKDLYTLNKNGLCEYKDTCTENEVICGEDSACFNQQIKKSKNSFDAYKIAPFCGCKKGLGSSKSSDSCIDPCASNNNCKDLPFTQCKYIDMFDEHRCQCVPGFWRKNILADPCTPVKSSLRMNLIVVPKNTNVNPVRKKDRSKMKPSFYATLFEGDDRAHTLKEMKQAIERYNTEKNTNLTVEDITTFEEIMKPLDNETKDQMTDDFFATSFNDKSINLTNTISALRKIRSTDDNLFANGQKEIAKYMALSSAMNQCVKNLDFEGCIKKWNSAYQAANRLPNMPLGTRFIDAMLRSQLLDAFNSVFDKQIQDVNIVNFIPVDDLKVNQFGLQTHYNVELVLQSNDLDLTEELVREALNKKCMRESTNVNDEKYHTCIIQDLAILVIGNLKMAEFDLCDNTLTCPDRNYCYSRRRDDPNFDFKKDSVAYECRCKDGFKSVHVNEAGFFKFLNHTCEDIDECASPELNDCDEESTSCTNLIGSFRCDCDVGYKSISGNSTHCTALCSDSQCVNGDCEKVDDHSDHCKCYDDWKGINCDIPNAKVKYYKNSIIIIVVVAVILLILIVIGLVIYGRNYSEKKVGKKTEALKRELELVRLDNQRILKTVGSESHSKRVHHEGSDNPAFEGHK